MAMWRGDTGCLGSPSLSAKWVSHWLDPRLHPRDSVHTAVSCIPACQGATRRTEAILLLRRPPALSLTPLSILATEPVEEEEETPQLMRTKSDAACVIQRRPRSRAPGEAQRIRRHRFSINGHFYNHKVKSQSGLSPGPRS